MSRKGLRIFVGGRRSLRFESSSYLIVKKERLTDLLDENNQLIAIFTTIAKKVKARTKKSS